MTAPHPAKYSKPILELLDRVVPAGWILDPFAGVGRCFALERTGRDWRKVIGIEIEKEWITNHPHHRLGDATHLNAWFGPEVFDSVCTSPVYGNRLSDHHEAKDESLRHTYRHYLGRPLSDNNAGQVYAWSPTYWDLHSKVWSHCWTVLKPEGMLFLNTKNFVRKGEIVDVTGGHRELLKTLGYAYICEYFVECPGQRHGANRDLRVTHENVSVYRKIG